VLKKINATRNPGCTLFNSECTISAKNTLRIGPDTYAHFVSWTFKRASPYSHRAYLSCWPTLRGRQSATARHPVRHTDSRAQLAGISPTQSRCVELIRSSVRVSALPACRRGAAMRDDQPEKTNAPATHRRRWVSLPWTNILSINADTMHRVTVT